MVSFWFLVIYATMRVYSARNREHGFLLAKLGVSFLLVALFLHSGLLELVFAGLELLGIEWDVAEALFRLRLDLAIVYVGMLVSLAVLHAPTLDPALLLRAKPWAIPACMVAIAGYVWYEATTPKQAYNQVRALLLVWGLGLEWTGSWVDCPCIALASP
jgi:hypothetical protein